MTQSSPVVGVENETFQFQDTLIIDGNMLQLYQGSQIPVTTGGVELISSSKEEKISNPLKYEVPIG